MAEVPTKRAMGRVPGGMMIVPLLLGSLVAAFAPELPRPFGSSTGAPLTGALPILAVFYVCMGATTDISATPYVLRKGGALFAAKVAIGMAAGVVLGQVLGQSTVGGGLFAGLSTLAAVAALNDTNGALHMALMGHHGKSQDAAAYSTMSLQARPFLAMVTLGVARLSAFPWRTLVHAVGACRSVTAWGTRRGRPRAHSLGNADATAALGNAARGRSAGFGDGVERRVTNARAAGCRAAAAPAESQRAQRMTHLPVPRRPG